MRNNRKEIRRKHAQELREKRDSITDQQQLEKLDRMFGKGQGAVKERAKLLKRIEESKKQEEAKVSKKSKSK